MWKSVAGGVAVTILSLVSMGVVGGALGYLASPVLYPLFGSFDSWSGDAVWPAMILSGMLWGLTFPVAALAVRRFNTAGSWLTAAFIYILVLWLSAVAIWVLLAAILDVA